MILEISRRTYQGKIVRITVVPYLYQLLECIVDNSSVVERRYLSCMGKTY